MKRFPGAALLLFFTLQLAAGISQERSDKAATGNFTGRITDETGKPLIGVPVQALQYGINVAGERELQQFRAVVSDDRGDYRLFALAPGRYYIGIGGSATGRRSAANYEFSYYPGVSDITQAATLEIFPGNDTHADLRAVRQQQRIEDLRIE